MARVSYGSLVTEINGSIGGTTFQRNKFGFTVKNKGIPAGNGSVPQLQIRQNTQLVTHFWGAITAEDRATWDAFALAHPQPIKANSLIMLTGYALFLKFNLLMLSSGQGLQSVALDGVLPSASINPFLFYDAGRLKINPVGSPTVPTNWWLTSITPPVPPQLNYVRSPLRFMIILNQNSTIVDITDYYIALFGQLPPSGSTVWLRTITTSGAIPQISSPTFFKRVIDVESM